MNACQEIPCGSLLAGRDTPKVLDVIEELFDRIALGIKGLVTITWNLAV